MPEANPEVVVAPFDISIAELGTPFPDVDAAMVFGDSGASTSHAGWRRLGREQSRSMDVSGIQMNREAQDGSFYSYGGGRKVKAWTVQEDLMFSGQMADFTLETISDMIEDGQAIVEVAAASGLDAFGANSTAGAGYDSGDVYFTMPDPAADEKGAGLLVTIPASGIPGTPTIINPGRYSSAPSTAAVKTAFDAAYTGGATTQVGFDTPALATATLAGFRSIVLGRRGGRLAKKASAFLVRGAASPYLGGERAQIEVPAGVFEGSRNMTLTRADPIKYDFQIACLEDRGIDGYANLLAID